MGTKAIACDFTSLAIDRSRGRLDVAVKDFSLLGDQAARSYVATAHCACIQQTYVWLSD